MLCKQKRSHHSAVLALFISLGAVLATLSCASNHAVVSEAAYTEREQSLYVPAESEISWQEISGCPFAGYFFYENKNYPVRYHCVKIDLASESLEIVTFPQSESDFAHKNGIRQTYFTGLRAGQFSKKYSPLIAVNSAPFGGKNGRWDKIAKITSTRSICGIHVADRHVLAPPRAPYSAICFTKTERGFVGSIVKNQGGHDFSAYDFAFGGFYTILSGGEKESFSWRSNDSRTAAGLSVDGTVLYLLVVEGERRSRSHGLSYPECADIMLALGASDALQLDGGGSSSLFVNGTNALSYPALRKNAVFIGFK